MASVPANLITGFLGVGKTTAIIDLMKHAGSQRWAVVINEVGDVGIDGAVLAAEGHDELVVREIAGGCICCTSGPMFQVHLVRLMREVRPDRVIVEPTGLAHPASLLDTMRRPGLGLDCKAVITLVDPSKCFNPRYAEHEVYADQIRLADVLVANRCDRASEEMIQCFFEQYSTLDPPKQLLASTSHGVLDPRWLDLPGSPAMVSRMDRLHQLPEAIDLRPGATGPAPMVPHITPALSPEVSTSGWIFPAAWVFDRRRLECALQVLVRPNPALPAGVLRLKGVFHTPGLWLNVHATDEEIQWRALNHRRDSRVEVIAPSAPAPDWDAVELALRESRWRRPS